MLECNDMNYITYTNIKKIHSSLFNSKVSKKIRNQGETLFCWAFAISTMLRQSLNLFISDCINSLNLPENLNRKLLEKTYNNLSDEEKTHWWKHNERNWDKSGLREKCEKALKILNRDDFHRQLRNELIMIPIPKILSNEHIRNAPLTQGHYLDMAFERVSYFHWDHKELFVLKTLFAHRGCSVSLLIASVFVVNHENIH